MEYDLGLVSLLKRAKRGYRCAGNRPKPENCEQIQHEAQTMQSCSLFLLLVATGRMTSVAAQCNATLMESSGRAFFEATATGKSWNGTKAYVTSEQASFSADVRHRQP
jgi:hypothetical protein